MDCLPFTILCYIEQGGSYLMLHRVSKKKDVNKDKWIGVGGHLEDGTVSRLPPVLPISLKKEFAFKQCR